MIPCRDEAGQEKPGVLFARVASRLTELVRISTGQVVDRTFDALLCPVSAVDVAEWQPPVGPGHWAAFSFYGRRALEPLQSLYIARARSYGAALPQAGAYPWQWISDAESARGFLREIGLREIRIYAEQLGYHLRSSAEWWDIVTGSALGRLARQLPVEQLHFLKAEHLTEVAALAEGGPLWVHVPAIFAMGRRPPE